MLPFLIFHKHHLILGGLFIMVSFVSSFHNPLSTLETAVKNF